MKNFDDELNDYGVSNPDGKINNVYENKIDFNNEKSDFFKENNTEKVEEFIDVKEQNSQKVQMPKKEGYKPNVNLVTLSSIFATAVVSVVGTVVVIAFVLTNSIINIDLFACTCESLTFYVQMNEQYSETGNEQDKDMRFVARLYKTQDLKESQNANTSDGAPMQEYSLGFEPFIEFTELEPDTYYTLEVYDYNGEKVLLQKEYKTAPEDCYAVGVEMFSEEAGNFILAVYPDEVVNTDFYTINVFDEKGKRIFVKDIGIEENEYVIPMGNSYMYYAFVTTNRNGYNIGRMEYLYNEFYDDGYQG